MLTQDAKPWDKSKRRVKLQFRASKRLNNVQDRRYTTIWKMRFSEYFDDPFFFLTMFEKINDREKIKKTCYTMSQKDRKDLNLHFSAITSPTISQNQQKNRLWKIRFWAYVLWSIFFWTHHVQRQKHSRGNRENMLNYGADRQRRYQPPF